jgi:hypothetical protein
MCISGSTQATQSSGQTAPVAAVAAAGTPQTPRSLIPRLTLSGTTSTCTASANPSLQTTSSERTPTWCITPKGAFSVCSTPNLFAQQRSRAKELAGLTRALGPVISARGCPPRKRRADTASGRDRLEGFLQSQVLARRVCTRCAPERWRERGGAYRYAEE